jgi:hypothetical protein
VGIRETLNEKPAIGLGIGIGIVVIAIVIIVWQFMGSSGTKELTGPMTTDQAYYSDDDGKTFFADASKKLTPFKHAGKDAVLAMVYRCSSGAPFVGYLERHTAQAKHLSGIALEMGNRPNFADPPVFELKKPGNGAWVPADNKNVKKVLELIDVTCPGNASEAPQKVYPGATK